MEKKELANILSEVLTSVGFKKKGDYWVLNGSVITKMVNLQKSQYSNSFYINYGYILKSLPLNGKMMHIYNRMTSSDIDKRNRIEKLLNLENEISNNERIFELKEEISKIIISDFQIVNTEEDLLNSLKERPNLNSVPLDVKKHFGLMDS